MQLKLISFKLVLTCVKQCVVKQMLHFLWCVNTSRNTVVILDSSECAGVTTLCFLLLHRKTWLDCRSNTGENAASENNDRVPQPEGQDPLNSTIAVRNVCSQWWVSTAQRISHDGGEWGVYMYSTSTQIIWNYFIFSLSNLSIAALMCVFTLSLNGKNTGKWKFGTFQIFIEHK